MNDLQNPFKSPGGIRKVTEVDRLSDDGQNTVISRILGTREVRELIGGLLPQVLCALAGDSRVKRFVFRKAGNYIQKSLSRPGDVLEKSELPHLFEDEGFIKEMLEPLPGITGGLMTAVSTIVKTIEELPTKEKKEVLSGLLSGSETGQQGQLINSFARIMIDIYKDDPEFLTHTFGPGLAKRLDQTDFGELNVFLDGTFKDLISLFKVASDTLFNKPAKVVLLLTVLPSLINMVSKIFEDILTRFNTFPPDLVADALLSIFREIDGKSVGVLANEGMELFRKINVGSALIGDPGMPQCRLDIAAFIDDMTSQIDVELLWKFRELVAVSKERANLSLLSILKKKPELVIERLRNAPKIRNYHIRAIKQNMGLIESLPETKALEAIQEGIANIDSNAMAEIINTISIMINRLNASSPDLLPNLADEFVKSLDLDEFEDAVKCTMESLREAIKPLGHIIFPNLIKMTAEWISTNGNGRNKELDQARETIVQFLNYNEVAA
jgi:hypothetical protein